MLTVLSVLTVLNVYFLHSVDYVDCVNYVDCVDCVDYVEYVDCVAGKYRQIGITSFGSGLGCEIGMHAAFTRVESFLQWIETNTGVAVEP